MLEWPPRDVPPQPLGKPTTAYPLVTLRALFHHAYTVLPDWVWGLPLPQQSDELLRHIAKVAQSYTPAGLQRLCDGPGVHPGEYAIISAFANLGDEIESFLHKLNAANPDDDFIAGRLDPEGRRGRAPS